MEAFLALARQRFRLCVDAEAEARQQQLSDYQFSLGEQWSDADRRTRGDRPALTNNRTDVYIRQVVNQMRELIGAIQIDPIDDGADPETAEVLQGLIRHIERQSDADIAYSTAGDHVARMGIGYVRVVPEYVSTRSMLQELTIRRVRNRFSVYLDPAAAEPDGSDARFAFVVEDLDPEDFRERYPTARLSSLSEWSSLGDDQPLWRPAGTVRVAEYFYVQTLQDELLQLSDGRLTTLRDLPDPLPEGLDVLGRRPTEERQICWAKITADDILDGNDRRTAGRVLPIPMLPLVRVIGEESDCDGKVDYRGMTRSAKDAQKLANYIDSGTAETVGLAPKAPYLVEFDQVSEFKTIWDHLNTKNYPYLPYKATSAAGHLVPPPTRNTGVDGATIQALTFVAQRAENHLRALLGHVDVGESERRPEQSGKAILARQRQGELSNAHLLGNLRRAKRQVGRILLAWLPHIYDTPRVLRITGLDDKPKTVAIAGRLPPGPPSGLPAGVDRIYDLSVGRYDVSVADGPSFASRRQEAVDAMTLLLQAAPKLLEVMGDLYFENLDWPHAREIAERLKKLLPPPLQAQATGPGPPIPPALIEQHQALIQALNALTADRQRKAQELEAEHRTKQAELAAKLEIARLEQATARAIAQARLDTEMAIALARQASEREMAAAERAQQAVTPPAEPTAH